MMPPIILTTIIVAAFWLLLKLTAKRVVAVGLPASEEPPKAQRISLVVFGYWAYKARIYWLPFYDGD